MRKHRPTRSVRPAPLFDTLESRKLMSAGEPNFSNFSSVTGLALNGSAQQSGANLILQTTDEQSGTAWWNQKVEVTNFNTQFTLQPTAHNDVDDYFTFALQNGSTTALGADDINSGYANGTVPNQAVAVAFTTENLGSGSGIQILTGNAQPNFNSYVQMPGVVMSNTDTFNVSITYNGTNLSVTVTDAAHPSDTYTTSQAIDLANVLGGTTAYAGFTVGTGTDDTVTTFNSWTYGDNAPAPTPSPTFTQAAAAGVNSTGTGVNLSALASITDGSDLTYAWTDLTKPGGAGTPVFSTPTANSTFASLTNAGTYQFQVTVTSSNGTSSVSDVSITIAQRPTRLLIEPHGAQVHRNKHYQFYAAVVDQFGRALSTQPTIKFYVRRGGGTIKYKTGFYTAGNTAGELEIEAKGGGLAGKALEEIA